MIRCALESPDLGQAFKYLGRYYITHEKFSRATWSRKVSQKLMKVRNFESLSWLWRVKFCIFQLFRSVASSLRIVWSWFNVRWRVLILGKLLNTLGVILSPIEIFLEPIEVEKFLKNLMKVRNFESLSWLWRVKFCILHFFCSIASLVRVVWLWFDVCWRFLVSTEWGRVQKCKKND